MLKKTNFILFVFKSQRFVIDKVILYIDSTAIDQVEHTVSGIFSG